MQITAPLNVQFNTSQRAKPPSQGEQRDTTASGQKATQSLDVEQLRQLEALKSRDLEVRNHEQAHLSAAGGIAISGASFDYAIGPDGQQYAIGGEVSIDTSEVPNDPVATLRKAETIRRAALAPAQPSSQDYQVAGSAAAMAAKASAEWMRQQQTLDRVGSQLNVTA